MGAICDDRIVAGETTVGIDVGGTKVAAARVEGDEIVDRLVEPTEKASGEALIDQMVRMALAVGAPEVSGVGAGVASEVDWHSGRVVGSVNIPLEGLAVRDLLAERTGLPAAIDNDGIAAAVGEAWVDGAPRGDLVMLTIGTGVGGGIVIDGKPCRGATGAAGHLGHMIVAGAPDPPRVGEGFPRPDSLEAQAAGSALDVLAREAAEGGDGELARLVRSGSRVSGRDAVAAARDGDPVALDLLERFAGRLAPGVANAIHFLDPDEVVIGGGVSAAGDLLLEPLSRMVEPLLLPGVGTRTTIRISRRGPDVGVLGAALLPRLSGPDQAG